jgi:dihydroorotate dehydrogenase (fumarate)
MNLATTYLGCSLPHPLMPGASPLVDDLDMVRRLEDAGAAAIVMHSLFEEQIAAEDAAVQGGRARRVVRRGAQLRPRN